MPLHGFNQRIGVGWWTAIRPQIVASVQPKSRGSKPYVNRPVTQNDSPGERGTTNSMPKPK